MIKNIIFDIGGVLVEEDFKKYIYQRTKDVRLASEIYHNAFSSEEFKEFLKGNITRNEMFRRMKKNQITKVELVIEMLQYDNLGKTLPIKQESIDYYLELKKRRYKIYILSNLTLDTYRYLINNYNFIQQADKALFSCYEHTLKPEEEFYHRLLQRNEMRPKECIFIDDKRKNIDTAKRLGIHGILFENIEQVRQEVEALLEKKGRKEKNSKIIEKNMQEL